MTKRNPGVGMAHKNEALKHPQHRHNINIYAQIDDEEVEEENLSDFIFFFFRLIHKSSAHHLDAKMLSSPSCRFRKKKKTRNVSFN